MENKFKTSMNNLAKFCLKIKSVMKFCLKIKSVKTAVHIAQRQSTCPTCVTPWVESLARPPHPCKHTQIVLIQIHTDILMVVGKRKRAGRVGWLTWIRLRVLKFLQPPCKAMHGLGPNSSANGLWGIQDLNKL